MLHPTIKALVLAVCKRKIIKVFSFVAMTIRVLHGIQLFWVILIKDLHRKIPVKCVENWLSCSGEDVI